MPDVAIVVDSTHYMPPEFAAQQGWSEVSLYVNLGGEQERELDLTDLDDFYTRLKAGTEMATTSQPSIGDFLTVFEPLLTDGRDIVAITLSSGISGTRDSALQAAEQARQAFPGRRIEVVDSRTAAGALGMITMTASAAARAGGDVDAVAERARVAAEELRMWFAVDSLEYLRRGGRIGPAQAFLGTALKIKPILSCRDEIQPIEKVRTFGRALERLVAFAQERRDAGCDVWMVQHIQTRQACEQLADRLQEVFGTPPLGIGQVGPVIGAHTGPGLMGFAAMPGSLLT